MNIRKWIAGAASIVVLMSLAAGAALAQETAIGIASGNSITYTSGTMGGLVVATTNGTYQNYLTNLITSGTTVTFTGMGNTYVNGVDVYTPPSTTNNNQYTQELNPGTFTISKNGTTLLSGTFSYSNLTGNDASPQPTGEPGTTTSANVTLLTDSVTYTGGTMFDPTKFSSTNGSLSMEFTASGPIVASSTQVNSFMATDGVTFEAIPITPVTGTPEPASLVGLALGFAFLAGLALRAKKRKGLTLA